MPHPQRPSTWTKYRDGDCKGCFSGCCQLPVEASVNDLIRLEYIDEMEAASMSPTKIANKLKKQRLIQRFSPASGLFVLAQRANEDCLLLDEKTRLCTRYEKRPAVCRQFPKIGPRPGFCPKQTVVKKSSNT